MTRSKSPPTRKLYTSELALPAEHVERFFDWYAYRHAPDLYQAGFEVCTSYRAIEGDMAILDLYEIDSTEVFETAPYRAVSANDPYAAALLAHRTAKAHTVYSQLHVLPEPGDAPLHCDWLRIDRFNTTASSDRLRDYLDGDEAERILQAGAKRVRLAERTKAAPRHVSNRPTFMLLTEWATRPALSDIGARLATQFGSMISEQSAFVGHRKFPWPDDPDLRR